MSLNSINAYVNEMISSNREQSPEHITTYFTLMEQRATEMLQQMQAATRLLGLADLSETVLNHEQKKVVIESVNYILANATDLSQALGIIKESGLLDLETSPPESRYHMLYKLEPVLRYASEIYSAKLNWWGAFKQRNKRPSYFVERLELASVVKEVETQTQPESIKV